jgi:hypothetical protein
MFLLAVVTALIFSVALEKAFAHDYPDYLITIKGLTTPNCSDVLTDVSGFAFNTCTLTHNNPQTVIRVAPTVDENNVISYSSLTYANPSCTYFGYPNWTKQKLGCNEESSGSYSYYQYVQATDTPWSSFGPGVALQ